MENNQIWEMIKKIKMSQLKPEVANELLESAMVTKVMLAFEGVEEYIYQTDGLW